ncbi:NERD domain-containing protein [Salicibibacter cibarius]|uniref:NERD domain-containing protein n=2 Tax=Salicibibacter cibarius TaxID=2743000 RepID=A0A7T6Z676_9BACI|nr:NERD domain-containing protein [Salicibibacter cibarius]
MALEAMKRRLLENHPRMEKVSRDHRMWEVGYKGECSLDFYLKQLPEGEYWLFYGLCLKTTDGEQFQIDTMLLSKRVAILLEIKTIAGEILFDEDIHQFSRTYQGEVKSFSHPYIQVARQRTLLRQWLNARGYFNLPVAPLVISGNPSATLTFKNAPRHFMQSIVRAEVLPQRVLQLKKENPADQLSSSAQKELSQQLLDGHHEQPDNVVEAYNISRFDLLTGVHCPSCFKLSMQRIHGNGWHCPRCSFRHKMAHAESLKDYRILFQPSISNREARIFLDIPSASIVRKLLTQLELPIQGKNKSRRYMLTDL